jgi:CheY-like chemotaxis protein
MAERGARLLVADDNKVNRLLLKRSLELQGHRVDCAENGRVALEMLRSQPFDLLLLDMEMPEMNGFQVLEQAGRRPAPRRSAGARDVVARRRRPCRALHRARRRRLPAEARESGPAEGPHRFESRKKRLRDQQKELVRRFATSEVAQDLQQSGFALGGRRIQRHRDVQRHPRLHCAVESQPPEETIELLNTWYTLMFDAISGQGGVVNQMIGDGLMAIFGAPLPLADAAGRAVRAALDMIEMIELLNVERSAAGKPALRIGIGIASGEMVAGYTGTQQSARPTPASAIP